MEKALQRKQTRDRVKRYREKVKSVALHTSVTDHRTEHLAKALIDPIKRAKLILISKALDKEVTGLDGQRVNIGTMVRYGIFSWTFKEIGGLL